jgi:hypothetical protein
MNTWAAALAHFMRVFLSGLVTVLHPNKPEELKDLSHLSRSCHLHCCVISTFPGGGWMRFWSLLPAVVSM